MDCPEESADYQAGNIRKRSSEQLGTLGTNKGFSNLKITC